MAKALNKIFWGSLLVFLNFHINHFDILPDFLGYIIIFLGLTDLVSYSEHFSKAKSYVLILAAGSLPLIYQFEVNMAEPIEMTANAYGLMAIYIGVAFVHLGFVYHFMRGLMDIAQENPFKPLEKKTRTFLRFYIILTLATQIVSMLILIPYALSIGLILAPLILLLAIVSFIVEIMLLVLIRQFRSISLLEEMK